MHNKTISLYLLFEGINGLALTDGYWKIIPYGCSSLSETSFIVCHSVLLIWLRMLLT